MTFSVKNHIKIKKCGEKYFESFIIVMPYSFIGKTFVWFWLCFIPFHLMLCEHWTYVAFKLPWNVWPKLSSECSVWLRHFLILRVFHSGSFRSIILYNFVSLRQYVHFTWVFLIDRFNFLLISETKPKCYGAPQNGQRYRCKWFNLNSDTSSSRSK